VALTSFSCIVRNVSVFQITLQRLNAPSENSQVLHTPLKAITQHQPEYLASGQLKRNNGWSENTFLRHTTKERRFFSLKPTRPTNFPNFILSKKKLYMFRAGVFYCTLDNWYISCRFDEGFQPGSGLNILTLLGNAA
jgi:hypothetical protein